MSDHDGSAPPPSPVPSAPDGREASYPPELERRRRTGSFPGVDRREGDAEHALRVVRDLRDGPSGVGRPPIPAAGFAGTGLWKFTAESFDGVATRLDAIEVSLTKVLSRLGATDSVGLWLVKEGGRVLLGAAIFALLAYLSGHWR